MLTSSQLISSINILVFAVVGFFSIDLALHINKMTGEGDKTKGDKNPKSKGPTPQELRKIEKDKRRKQYEDIQVQNTNNSSIVSKRSVEMVYQSVCPPGEWFKYFVPKGKRRSPAINRGYWIRMESIRQLVYRIVDQHPDCSVNVINLGCGFDPLPFQLLSGNKYQNLTFYDIDYPELVENKKQMILKAKELTDLLGDSLADPSLAQLGWKMNYPKYKLLGCDLRNHTLYEKQLQEIPQGDGIINIFIAEVSLAYMHFDDANKIINHSSKVANGHFLILEQIIPSGDKEAFTKKMLAHFRKLRSALKCVEQYPTKQHQYERFKQYYHQVEIQNLFENWNQLVDDKVKAQVDGIEEFDEWEEFILFCQHYIITHATNTDVLVYKQPESDTKELQSIDLDMSASEVAKFDLKFPASCVLEDSVYTMGGLQQSRINSMYKDGSLIEVQGDEINGRMCHSFTAVSETKGLIIGGRTKPNAHLSDIYLFQTDEKTFKKMNTTLPYPVSRHSVISINQEEVVILGGQDNTSEDKVIKYNWVKDQVLVLSVVSKDTDFNISQLKSAGVCYNGNEGYIVGGMVDKQTPRFSNHLLRFELTEEQFTVEVKDTNPIYERVDCKLEMVSNGLLMIGGINYHQHLNQHTVIMKIGFDLQAFGCKIPDQVWNNTSPVMIGHNTVVRNNTIEILAGGVVCYSFGSEYSYNYKVII